ncbi:hypothetical protein EJ05DRAFT_91232 [Pseudovirgaria hyperparasitica]|uniref:Carbohydrate esterase family 16 protein n=1 Tax=Pseudovirgaria hyperparasitica TaxID=470096 RepID=A0A6A6W2G0_9PEZI|nr:uncharacterized protein EJ05DRAFT_91232 [Pseudovirgaria hyperparasitica]KAF2756140.1 hypothetical protein EJ05DRAFT_91232 [Pseudovirgaria hyperparasitica]
MTTKHPHRHNNGIHKPSSQSSSATQTDPSRDTHTLLHAMLAFLLTPLSTLLLAALSTALTSPKSPTSPHHLFTFGDSYSQTGFNISLALPSRSNPIGNPSFPGWTTSGGPNWLGYLTTRYNTSLVLTYNFASGGATVDAALVAPYTPSVLSLGDQVRIFTDNAHLVDWRAAGASTFAVWIGVNDVGNSWWMDDETARVQRIIARYFELVADLYDAGARRFVFLGVPPITRSPLVLRTSDAPSRALEDSVIATFNSTLSTAARQFATTHADAHVYVVNTTPAFATALDHPEVYGAPDATCFNEDGRSCLWFNDYHPAMAIQGLVAREVARVVGGVWGA